MASLTDKTIAIVATNGFEEQEFADPKRALEDADATVHVISLTRDPIKAMKAHEWTKNNDVDKAIDDAAAGDYDALVLPGGVMNPDALRSNRRVVAFVTAFLKEKKPIGAICHGPQTLIETGMLSGRTMTSYPSIQTDLKNAGATWIDKEVVTDGMLITSRTPDDIPAFNQTLIELVAST